MHGKQILKYRQCTYKNFTLMLVLLYMRGQANLSSVPFYVKQVFLAINRQAAWLFKMHILVASRCSQFDSMSIND